MRLELNDKELETLKLALRSRMDEVMKELVHTTQRPYRSSLRSDYEQLEALLQRCEIQAAPKPVHRA